MDYIDYYASLLFIVILFYSVNKSVKNSSYFIIKLTFMINW